jgi:hypothetical protein
MELLFFISNGHIWESTLGGGDEKVGDIKSLKEKEEKRRDANK